MVSKLLRGCSAFMIAAMAGAVSAHAGDGLSRAQDLVRGYAVDQNLNVVAQAPAAPTTPSATLASGNQQSGAPEDAVFCHAKISVLKSDGKVSLPREAHDIKIPFVFKSEQQTYRLLTSQKFADGYEVILNGMLTSLTLSKENVPGPQRVNELMMHITFLRRGNDGKVHVFANELVQSDEKDDRKAPGVKNIAGIFSTLENPDFMSAFINSGKTPGKDPNDPGEMVRLGLIPAGTGFSMSVQCAVYRPWVPSWDTDF